MSDRPIDEFLATFRIGARLAARAVLSVDDGRSLQESIWSSGLPRRSIEDAIGHFGDRRQAVDGGARTPRLDPATRRELALIAGDDRASAADGGAAAEDRLAAIAGLIERAPAPRRSLDHVPATPESVVGRAEWMASGYFLDGASVVFVGDHDLTSIALAGRCPATEIVVVDIDERLLEFIRRVSEERGLGITCVYADVTLGVPAHLRSQFDLAFSDPPYTDVGMQVFASAAIQLLRRHAESRILLSFGFSRRHPALGLKAQQALVALGLAFEAVLPRFDRYDGAEAVASASNLHVCVPTKHSPAAADSCIKRAPSSIYTHGERSIESDRTTLPLATRLDVLAGAGLPGERVAEMWDAPGDSFRTRGSGVEKIAIGRVLSGDERTKRDTAGAVLADLRLADDSRLLRLLLAANLDTAIAVVDAAHPDLRAPGLDELRRVLAGKYTLAARPVAGTELAVVVGTAVGHAADDPPPTAILDRVFSPLSSIWRDVAKEAHHRSTGGRLGREDVAVAVQAAIPPRHRRYGGQRPIDLDRSLLADLLAETAVLESPGQGHRFP